MALTIIEACNNNIERFPYLSYLILKRFNGDISLLQLFLKRQFLVMDLCSLSPLCIEVFLINLHLPLNNQHKLPEYNQPVSTTSSHENEHVHNLSELNGPLQILPPCVINEAKCTQFVMKHYYYYCYNGDIYILLTIASSFSKLSNLIDEITFYCAIVVKLGGLTH